MAPFFAARAYVHRRARAQLSRIELLPAMSEPAVNFLHTLDCFFYRTGWFVEPSGRVIAEAMACGLPVVVGQGGGYEDLVEHGVSGFVVQDNDEAEDVILQLASEPELRREVGRRARARVLNVLGDAAAERALAAYLLGDEHGR